MKDERAYVARLESTDANELAGMLARPTVEEEKTLRVYLGDARYERMHALALRRNARRGTMDRPRGNVVVIPGIMGSELTTVDRRGDLDHVWVQVPRLAAGRLFRLRLDESGLAEHDPGYDVHATGVLKKYYGELLLSLSERWNVRAFWYDWRKDLNLAADELKARLGGWFAEDAPVHIVAHSMGGLVARTFIKNHPERWKKMRGEKGSGGRLIMLGTPNHGSFMIPQAIAGVAPIVKQLALLDIFHSVADLLPVMNSFVGSYQMLPSPLRLPEMRRLYEAATYGSVAVSQARLTNALRHHEALSPVVDPERMLYVAGRDRPTIGSINFPGNLADLATYGVTTRGDGTVPHELGLLATEDGAEVDTYYVDEEHGNLPRNPGILAALDELLETGETGALEREPTAPKRGPGGPDDGEDARERWLAERAAEQEHLQTLLARNSLRSAGDDAEAYVSGDERQIEEILTREFLGRDGQDGGAQGVPEAPFPTATIEIGLVCGELQDLPYGRVKSAGGDPVDAISVGHYINVRPQEAELALDRAISGALRGREDGAGLSESELLLTQYFERGIIRGRLGQPFFLPDPRPGRVGRLIAIAGMGLPGGFGAPELAVLSRELCWSLGRMERRHLATVLIGAGTGNLSTREAVSAWMRGIKNALTGSIEDEGRRLLRITFVERDPDTVEEMAEAFREEKRRLEARNRLMVEFHEPDKTQLQRKREAQRGEPDRRGPGERPPTRVTLSLEGDNYRFGAITESASVPERKVPLDPTLVMEANQELAAESDATMQAERGAFLQHLLVPVELRAQFATDAPLVMMLDSTIARIHWEMVARPDRALPGGPSEFDPDRFLGTARGFTRQLRTTYAPPPEPPPPPRRILRVLVVADPAEDAHLPGAEEEGAEVAALFENFNAVYEHSSYSRVEVVRLFGPYAATRTNVIRALMSRSFDVLHFAGHCVYREGDPRASGWLFSGGKLITANELGRIDRVPKFVFSNACESGVTPDRSEMRSDMLAPSFAERFFERGVTDFVCTAWPVEDISARLFALTLYAQLLGLRPVEGREDRFEEAPPQPMYAAMREARLSIAGSPDGARTWGAYQHYGSPYFRFFDRGTITERRDESEGEAATEPVLRNGQKTRARSPTPRPQRRTPDRQVLTE